MANMVRIAISISIDINGSFRISQVLLGFHFSQLVGHISPLNNIIFNKAVHTRLVGVKSFKHPVSLMVNSGDFG